MLKAKENNEKVVDFKDVWNLFAHQEGIPLEVPEEEEMPSPKPLPEEEPEKVPEEEPIPEPEKVEK